MKKLLIAFLALAVIMSVGLVSAFGETSLRCFCEDKDSDGVCDNFIDENCHGICDNRGRCQGRNQHKRNCHHNFVDENGDGICDNYDENRCQGKHRACEIRNWF